MTVQVGGFRGPLFYVYPNILRRSSEYFRQHVPINGHSHEQHIELPLAEARIFNIYLHFLTFGKIPCHQSNSTASECDDDSENNEYDILCQLYMFADKIMDSQVMNAAIGALMSRYNDSDRETVACLPRHSTIQGVYNNTSPNSPLRRLLVDMRVWYGREDAVGGDEYYDTEPEIVIDLARALLRKLDDGERSGKPIPAGVKTCDYHEPGSCEACVHKKRKRSG